MILLHCQTVFVNTSVIILLFAALLVASTPNPEVRETAPSIPSRRYWHSPRTLFWRKDHTPIPDSSTPFVRRRTKRDSSSNSSSSPSSSTPEIQEGEEDTVICRAEGLCEKCPPISINEPFCQPYGNRRLIKCLPNTPENERLLRESKVDPGGLAGETPAWEACGKVVAVERADYYEFFLCNALFASVSLFVLLARSKQLAAVQYRKLAARIGL